MPQPRRRREDPTAASRVIREYEVRLVSLFVDFRGTILQGLTSVRTYADVPTPPVDIAKFAPLLDEVTRRKILDPGKALIADSTRKGYTQGTLYAQNTLEGMGIPTIVFPPRGGPIDWRALDALKVRNLEVLKGISADTNKEIILSLTEGLNHGESMPALAGRITDAVDTIGLVRARTMARTETMFAVNQGTIIRYTQAGIEEVKWLTAWKDGRICEQCAALDGQIFPINQVPEIPVHPNCILGDTRCETPGGIIAGLRAFYNGPVLEIATAQGRRLTITPNHLFLLEAGFIEADRLRKGDKVICRPLLEGIVPDDPDDNRYPPTAQEVVESLAVSPGMPTSGVPVTPKDLHSDGRFCNGNIDIIGAYRHLLHSPKAPIFKQIRKAYLNGGGEFPTLLAGLSSPEQFLFSAAVTTDGGLSSTRKASSFFWGRPRHTEMHGFAPPPGSDSSGFQPDADATPGNSKQIRELLDRFAGVVELDEIVDINVRTFRGHVYDLQTVPTLYFGNGILISNCRCALAPIPVER